MSCPAGYTFDPTSRVAPFAAATEAFELGQRIKYWDGDIIWTKHHLPASRLEPLRCLGDPLADEALAALDIKRGEDALEALLAYTAESTHEQKSPAPQQLLTQVMTVPDWVDWDRIKRGQQVFCHEGHELHRLRVVSGEKTKQRILETAQFVYDVFHSLDYLQPGSGLAWKSFIQIRLLHGGVRARLLKISRAHPKYYNLKEDGVPINQEDQLSTLFSLSSMIWQVIERRQGVQMTTQERGDFLHVWRYVGYIMGVDDVLGVIQTPERAEACMESMRLHLEKPNVDSGRMCSTMFHNLTTPRRHVVQITKTTGLINRYKLHLALSEHLFGPELWVMNGLPPITRSYRALREMTLSVLVFDLWLITKSSWWFRFRTLLLREYLTASVVRRLGSRRTQFELRELPQVRASMSCPAGYTFDPAPRVAPFAAATETFKLGQRIRFWDATAIWTEHHLPASKLEPLRSLGDPLSDAALAALEIKPGEDALEALLAYTARPSDEQKSPAPQQFLTEVMTVPDWVDWDRIKRGQQVYWRYCLFMKFTLLHMAVAGGMSMSKPMKVLKSSSYLFGKQNERRVIETAQYVQELVHSPDYLRPGSGLAWKSTVRVRLLHSAVRARILKPSQGHPKYYDVEEYGVPINQEDLLAVMFSLSCLMWRAMEFRLGAHMKTQEREDFLHLWRYVGCLMGVDDILSVTQTPERADACLESMGLHLSDFNAESGRHLVTWTRNLYPRSRKAFGLLERYKLHMAMAEQLMGPEAWEIQELPFATWPYRVVKDLIIYLMFFDLWLVTKSPWWLRFRTLLLQELIAANIAKKLGKRRTQFELTALATRSIDSGSQFAAGTYGSVSGTG
ncbi:hypothetical protein BGZ70_006147 [Mortierella alpina]|uniref:ER-bound oxygenase mpaB/mpaB'/Rubber oxygenase catalytic domain-containing protein n=1 Tax=Mortierella alpina TaxID=64518 RepID=A0A9P6M6U9_MORAP|nr:hypothetical protein BGZ70_006147 [Mortierella alpina]